MPPLLTPLLVSATGLRALPLPNLHSVLDCHVYGLSRQGGVLSSAKCKRILGGVRAIFVDDEDEDGGAYLIDAPVSVGDGFSFVGGALQANLYAFNALYTHYGFFFPWAASEIPDFRGSPSIQ